MFNLQHEETQLGNRVFQTPLPQRWQIILDAYLAAKADGDDVAMRVSRYFPSDLLDEAGHIISQASNRGRRPFGGSQPQRDDAWYRAQLEEVCGRGIQVSSGSDSICRRVVRFVSVSSGSVYLSDAIVLGDVRVSSGSISGTAWTSPDASIRASSGSIGQGIQPASSMEKLYKKAVEFGIITD